MSKADNLSPNQRAWRRFRKNRPAMMAAIFLGCVIAIILIGPFFTRPPDAITDAQFVQPGSAHWFGTDVHGRDLLSRVLFGARISLAVGLIGAAVSLVIGVLWGAVAGYAGGRLDGIMMRCVDVLYALPSVVFVIVLVTAVNALLEKWQGAHALSEGGRQFLQFAGLFAGLGAVSWLTMARIVRGEVLTLRRRAFVDAGRVLGLSHTRILLRHILPNVCGVIIVYLTLTIPSIILYESFLSYLGLGVQAPQASLGSLIADGARQITAIRVYWWLIICPASVLALTLLALNFVGDGLRDAWDPRSERRS